MVDSRNALELFGGLEKLQGHLRAELQRVYKIYERTDPNRMVSAKICGKPIQDYLSGKEYISQEALSRMTFLLRIPIDEIMQPPLGAYSSEEEKLSIIHIALTKMDSRHSANYVNPN